MLGPVYKQIIFWAIYIAYLWLFAIIQDPNADFIVFFHKNVLVFAFFYIAIYISFPILFIRTKAALFILVFLTSLLMYYLFRYLLTNGILHLWGIYGYEDEINLVFFSNQAFLFLTYSTYALLIWYARKSYLVERQLRITETDRLNRDKEILQLKNDNLSLENEKIKLKNNYLTSQINPHFLYNTLHFLYNKTETHNKQAAQCIYLLTEIMSYALENESQDSMINLEEEVTHLQNYIELHQLRFNNTLYIKVEKQGDFSGIRIPHYSLITFIENAFKHGIVNDAAYPLHISLKVNDSRLIFKVKNKKDNALKISKPSSGLGLKNIRERMRMVYGDKQNIEITETENEFDLTMEIQIN